MGEEREVERKVQRARRGALPAADVDDVGHGLEGKEGYAQGQHDLQQRQRRRQTQTRRERRQAAGEEPIVLEPSQQPEVAGDRERQQPRADPLTAGGTGDQGGQHLVPGCAAGQQEHEVDVRAAIEDVARRDHERLPQARARHQRPRQRQDKAEEDRELQRGEDHGSLSLQSAHVS